ncbi:kinesin heavy chain [Cyclospora cayetanensis]|uniref:Kinesin-like protein n=1 Tax=Cyclospora cayetanensis TaxID=88456 RepID=A0A1D3D1J3_9EIME|nr:kinesin heavy chain [Cyclospora cayetanensis]
MPWLRGSIVGPRKSKRSSAAAIAAALDQPQTHGAEPNQPDNQQLKAPQKGQQQQELKQQDQREHQQQPDESNHTPAVELLDQTQQHCSTKESQSDPGEHQHKPHQGRKGRGAKGGEASECPPQQQQEEHATALQKKGQQEEQEEQGHQPLAVSGGSGGKLVLQEGAREGPLLQKGCAVCVRIRPESFDEAQTGAPCCLELGARLEGPRSRQNLLVHGLRQQVHRFSFDRIFDQTASQGEVFAAACLPVVRCALSGISGAVLAYGQTGSGKTYTMTGPLDESLADPLIDRGKGTQLNKAQAIAYNSRRAQSPTSPSAWVPPADRDRNPDTSAQKATGGGAGGRPWQASVLRQPLGEPPGGHTRASYNTFGVSTLRDPVDTGIPRAERPLRESLFCMEDAEEDSILRKHSAQVADSRGLMPRALEELFKFIETLKHQEASEKAPLESAPSEKLPESRGRAIRRSSENDSGVAQGIPQQGQMEIQLTATLVEIYNEKIFDLLDPSRGSLNVREAPNGQTFVVDALEAELYSYPQALQVIRRGLQGRACGRTAENSVSSRSHAVLSLTLRQRRRSEGRLTESTLNLVDLAGSERGDTSMGGRRLQESQAINKSLLALGNVVNALAGGSQRAGAPQGPHGKGGGPPTWCPRRRHVPYRESKLTRLLRHSLGGSAFAVLIICCSPHSQNLQETLCSLRFGDRASRLENKPAAQDKVSVAALREQLQDTAQTIRMYQACLRSLRIAVGQQQQAIGVLQHLIPTGALVSSEELCLLQAAKAAAKEAILADAAAHLPGGPRIQRGPEAGFPKTLVSPRTTRATSTERRTQSCPPYKGPPRQSCDRGEAAALWRGREGTPATGKGYQVPPRAPFTSKAAAAETRGAAAGAAARRWSSYAEAWWRLVWPHRGPSEPPVWLPS